MLQTEGGEEGCRGQGRHAQVGEEGEDGALLTVAFGFVFVFVFEEVSTFGGVGHCQTPGNWPHFICRVDQILKPFLQGHGLIQVWTEAVNNYLSVPRKTFRSVVQGLAEEMGKKAFLFSQDGLDCLQSAAEAM